jgi:FKBP-type peptidyl-prolyl cis-trans isomerase FkpA/FKBP-type peptidyl-prolyl cis-trans isomerase FklB
LAYGERGAGDDIGPNQDLVFTVELIKIKGNFLEDMAQEKDVKKTASGLLYKSIKQGTGISPTESDTVEVHYEGRLPNGKVFDSSYERGETIEFPLNGVIKGWTEGLQLMKEGGTMMFYIPSELAYGERGAPGAGIEPNQPLVFKVELVKVKKEETEKKPEVSPSKEEPSEISKDTNQS